jgi:hypothetical protein
MEREGCCVVGCVCFLAIRVLVLIKSIDRIRFTRLVTFVNAKFVPSSFQVAKFELGCQVRTWQFLAKLGLFC